MKVTSTTCTIALGGSSAYGDATVENDTIIGWGATKSDDGQWSVHVTRFECLKTNNLETIAAVKEAALAAIKVEEKKG